MNKRDGKDLIKSKPQDQDRGMGDILIDLGLGTVDDVGAYQKYYDSRYRSRVTENEQVIQDDFVRSLQNSTLGRQAEEFSAIRGQLLHNWLGPHRKTLAIVSPKSGEGRSYVAANLALALSQTGKATLLIDADMRAPQQHRIFNFAGGIGFSAMLAGQVNNNDLDVLPNQITSFQHLSILCCGEVPTNPAELLNMITFPRIIHELKKYFDVIILDTPPATYKSDIMSIASVAGSSLIVTRVGHTKIIDVKNLVSLLEQVKAGVVGSVLNQY